MRRRDALTAFAGLAGAMLLPIRAAHATAALTGNLEQGGMIVGRVPAGVNVMLDGKQLRVSNDGVFVFGFGRDQGAKAELTTAVGREVNTQVLAIKKREYNIQRIDGLPDKQVTPPDDAVARINRDNKLIGAARSHDTPETWFAGGIDWPITGRISGVYGSQRILNGEARRPHFGVDIAKGEGTPIKAPQKAIVRLAEKDLYFTGGTTILDHGGGITTSYLHQSRLDVAVGDLVEKGQVIGLVGKTGRATGPHLCWRLNWFAERLDPQLAAGPMPA